jgi:tetratricopeptide (TPR) repeat protein
MAVVILFIVLAVLFISAIIGSTWRHAMRYLGPSQKKWVSIEFSLGLMLILLLCIIFLVLPFTSERISAMIAICAIFFAIFILSSGVFMFWRERHFRRGTWHLKHNEWEQAVQSFRRGLEVIPDDVKCYHGQALAFVGLREYEQAVDEYDRAVSLAPKATDYYLNRGLIRAALGRYSQALEDLGRVLSLEPRRKKALFLMQDMVHGAQRQEPGAEDELTGMLERMSHYW